jgi:hypothetical protein
MKYKYNQNPSKKPKKYTKIKTKKAQDIISGAGARRDKKLRDAEKKALGIK